MPLLAAILTIPPLITLLGHEKFGILALLWAFVSYFGIFDLGLGKALTQRVSEIKHLNNNKLIGEIAGTALILLLAIGLIMGALTGFSSGILSLFGGEGSFVNNPEFHGALIALSIAIPAITLTSGLKGILESFGRFKLLMPIRMAMGIFTFVAPLLIAKYAGPNLEYIAWGLTIGRVIALYAHWVYAVSEIKKSKLTFESKYVRQLINAGGWLTVSNIVNPLMGYIDRFLIAAALSASAVTFYVTPLEIITKITIIPAAIAAALFPSLVEKIARDEADSWSHFIAVRSMLFWLLLPLVSVVAFNSEKILETWLNIEFSNKSGEILSLFAIGIFINSMAHMPLIWLQAEKKYKTAAIISIIQLPAYLLIFYYMTIKFGLLGAALAWCLRMAADSILLHYYCGKQQKTNLVRNLTQGVIAFTVFSASLLSANEMINIAIQFAVFLISFILFIKTRSAYSAIT